MCYVLSLNRERAEAVTHVMHTHKRSVGISLQRFLHYRLVHITLIHQFVLIGAATHFLSRNLSEVQRSVTGQKGFVFFLPIFAGRDGEGNEQKLGEEWGQAKQWKFVLKKNLRSINTSLVCAY